MRKIKTRQFDVANYLESDEDMAEYLRQVIEENDPAELAGALGVIARARIALFGAGPVPVRAEAAERILVGQTSSPSLVEAAARTVVDGLDPMSDLHAPASYRVSVARTLTARALTDALGRAKDVTR